MYVIRKALMHELHFVENEVSNKLLRQNEYTKQLHMPRS